RERPDPGWQPVRRERPAGPGEGRNRRDPGRDQDRDHHREQRRAPATASTHATPPRATAYQTHSWPQQLASPRKAMPTFSRTRRAAAFSAFVTPMIRGAARDSNPAATHAPA